MSDTQTVTPKRRDLPTQKINPEVKAKWLDALRSGQYTQTTGVLHQAIAMPDRPVGFCCLGVLCEVAIQEGVNLTPKDDGTGRVMYQSPAPSSSAQSTFSNLSTLPTVVGQWAGFHDQDGGIGVLPTEARASVPRIDPATGETYEAEATTLAEFNDSGYDFNQIADLIEKHL